MEDEKLTTHDTVFELNDQLYFINTAMYIYRSKLRYFYAVLFTYSSKLNVNECNFFSKVFT